LSFFDVFKQQLHAVLRLTAKGKQQYSCPVQCMPISGKSVVLFVFLV